MNSYDLVTHDGTMVPVFTEPLLTFSLPLCHPLGTDYLPRFKRFNIRIFDINYSIIQHGIGEERGIRSYNLPATLPSSTDRPKFPAQLLDD